MSVTTASLGYSYARWLSRFTPWDSPDTSETSKLLSYIFHENYFFLMRWNQLDVGIAVLSVIGIGLEEVEGKVAALCR